IGHPEWAENPRYKTHLARADHQTELDEMISAWTRTKTVAEVNKLMVEAAIPAGPINRPSNILADPHVKARDAIHWENHPVLGRVPMQNVFPKLSETPGAVRLPAPDTVGQHTDEVLGELLGMSASDLVQLRREAVI